MSKKPISKNTHEFINEFQELIKEQLVRTIDASVKTLVLCRPCLEKNAEIKIQLSPEEIADLMRSLLVLIKKHAGPA